MRMRQYGTMPKKEIEMKKVGNITAAIVAVAAFAAICAPILMGRTVAFAANTENEGLVYDIPLVWEYDGAEPDSACTDVILRIDKNLNVISASGEIIAPLSEIDIGARVPVYYARNTTEGNVIAEYLNSHGIYKALVASSSPAVVAHMRAKVKNVRGLLDLRELSEEELETREDWVEIRDALNINNAGVALLPGFVSADALRFLRRLSVSVWVDARDTSELVSAVSGGADGLLVADSAQAESTISELGERIIPAPFIIAHRGLSGIKRPNGSDYHENTVEAAWAAYKEGGADVIELDIYLTADNELVVNHNGALGGVTSGSGNMEDMTLAEIQKYKVTGPQAALAGNIEDPIPSLDDFFRKFKGEDCNIFIEIKGTKPAIVSVLKQKIEEYDFDDQCTVICFNYNHEFIADVREQIPYISVGRLLNYDKGETEETILKMCAPDNATFNPGYNRLTEEEIDEFKKCGLSVWPWTYRLQEDFERDYFYGASGLTLDYCGWLKEWSKNIVPESYSVKVEPDKKFALGLSVVPFGESSFETLYDFKQIAGDVAVTMDKDGWFTVSGEGSASIILIYENFEPRYNLLTAPITVISEKKSEEPTQPENPPSASDSEDTKGKKKGCGSSVEGAGVVLGITLLFCTAFSLVFKKSFRNL